MSVLNCKWASHLVKAKINIYKRRINHDTIKNPQL